MAYPKGTEARREPFSGVADPSRGGSVGYPESFRQLQVDRAGRGKVTQVSRSSLWRWKNRRGRERMTGATSETTKLVGVDQFWLCVFMFLYPDATEDEACVFIYDSTGSVYSREDVTKRKKEMKRTRKQWSTEIYQAFLPDNVLTHQLFWTQPPPLGIATRPRPRQSLIDVGEVGIELSNENGAAGFRLRKQGNYTRNTRTTVILAVEPGDPALPANTLGSIQHPRRWWKILPQKDINAFEFADFVSDMISDVVKNPVPLPQQPARTIMFDNRDCHLAPITINAIDVHPSGRFDHVPRPPYRRYEGPTEYVFCMLVAALNRRRHCISKTADLFVAIDSIIPNLSKFDETFIYCGYQ